MNIQELSNKCNTLFDFLFQVISTNTVDTDRAVGYIFSQDPKVKSQLNLVTCGGNFDKSKHLYDKRVVVASKLIN